MNNEIISLPKNLELDLAKRNNSQDEKINIVEKYFKDIEKVHTKESIEANKARYLANIYNLEGKSIDVIYYSGIVIESFIPAQLSSYSHYILLLIKHNTNEGKFEESLKWIDFFWEKREFVQSIFEFLSFFNQYVEVLIRFDKPFNKKYLILLQKLNTEIGFNLDLNNPLSAIQRMIQLNREWNRKLSLIYINSFTKEIQNQELLKFAEECPIQWYKDYVHDGIK
ncbi:hypothetical protein C9994_15135 [Marivirga lumbricoides]|uniref:Uncharacterized protein n=1 Tax=Marivirga lumbricoides TaxID=1046115 RepID=A0A2T4DCY5_9BACT|nr:hypothetical protein C9994_15135 [Marivirga lumbricoides]